MDDRTRQRIIWGLRRMSYRLGWRHQALFPARLPYGEYVCELCGIARRKQCFKCAGCAGAFCNKCTDADHIKPVVSGAKFTTWDDYINGMFSDPKTSGQALCKTCHKKKTAAESTERAALRRSTRETKSPKRGTRGSRGRTSSKKRKKSAAPGSI